MAAGGVFSRAHHTGDEPTQISLRDCRCIDRCGVAMHTHQVVSETTTTTTTTTTTRARFPGFGRLVEVPRFSYRQIASSCATETVRTVQTVQKAGDFTGAVLGDVVDTPVDVSTTGVMVQTVQTTVWRCRVRRGCGCPCDHAVTVHGFLRKIPRQAEVVALRKVFLPQFAFFFFFAHRPDGRECPFFGLRAPRGSLMNMFFTCFLIIYHFHQTLRFIRLNLQ